jgi:hypothetical protein
MKVRLLLAKYDAVAKVINDEASLFQFKKLVLFLQNEKCCCRNLCIWQDTDVLIGWEGGNDDHQ